MKDYLELQRIWDYCTANGRNDLERQTLNLLKDRVIRIRQDDGDLKQITVSRATSVSSGFVLGLRYVKRDGTCSEDLFAVEGHGFLQAHYKGSLQKIWPEYKGTHKKQSVFAEPEPTTTGNTISVVRS